MKSNKDFRSAANFADPDGPRGHKLPPAKKSGKERHTLYNEFEDNDDFEEPLPKKESVFDYFDDEEEDI